MCVCVCVCVAGVRLCVDVRVCVCVCAVHYDWLPREPLSKPTDALSDTVHFLESTFAAVQPLPDELVTSIALQGLKTLQGKMEALLNSEKVGAVYSGRVCVVCEGAVLCFRTPRSVWLGSGRLPSTSSCVRVSQTQWLCALCGVTFLICLPVCLSVCLSVCVSVCVCRVHEVHHLCQSQSAEGARGAGLVCQAADGESCVLVAAACVTVT